MALSNESRALGMANPKLGAIFSKLVRDLKYQAPQHPNTRPALEAAMLEYAATSGAPYESEYAQRYFDVGLTLACAYYPTHPFPVKLHIAIYSWLAIYIDDDDAGMLPSKRSLTFVMMDPFPREASLGPNCEGPVAPDDDDEIR